MAVITLERLGNLHLVFLHLPIGFVVAAVLSEFWSWRRPSAEGAWLQGRLLAANAVAALVAAGAGWMLASTGSYPVDLLALHRWAGVACAVLAVMAWLAQTRGTVRVARATLAALSAVTIFAGHQGATLTHGREVTAWWGASAVEAKKPAETPRLAPPVAPVFTTEIQPVLERSCIECHGPRKARGKLRLDTREAALAADKSGLAAITPGKPEASELLRRVKLPRDDDEAMPAGDKPGLTPAEIEALEKWIAAGAIWR